MKINGMEIEKGLLIRSPWIEKILDGEKTWEMRGYTTHIRGGIALIRSGSGLILGTCEIENVLGPLTLNEIKNNASKHCIPHDDIEHLLFDVFHYENVYAWVLNNAKLLNQPIPYNHPPGAVRWVEL